MLLFSALLFLDDEQPTPLGASGMQVTPQDILLRQLREVDETANPGIARMLHTALGSVYLHHSHAAEALKHYEAARNSAILEDSRDTDVLIGAHITLSKAFLQAGRAVDAFAELHRAQSNTGLSKDLKFAVELELGHVNVYLQKYDAALIHYEHAKKATWDPSRLAEVMSDIGEAHVLRGKPTESLHYFSKAMKSLESLPDLRSDMVVSDVEPLHLARDLHRRIADALHALNDPLEATLQYRRALELEKQSQVARPHIVSSIEGALEELQQGQGPGGFGQESSPQPYPAGAKIPESLPLPNSLVNGAMAEGLSLKSRVDLLMNDDSLFEAEAIVKDALATQQIGTHNAIEVASMLNLLGCVYRRQQRFEEAAARFLEALSTALHGSGASDPESTEAYHQLSFIQAHLYSLDRADAAKRIYNDAIAAADDAGIPAGNQDRMIGERRLRANAFPTVVMPRIPSVEELLSDIFKDDQDEIHDKASTQVSRDDKEESCNDDNTWGSFSKRNGTQHVSTIAGAEEENMIR